MKTPKDYFAKIKENIEFRRALNSVELRDQRDLTPNLLVLAEKYPERFFKEKNCMAMLVGVLSGEVGENSSKAFSHFIKFASLFPKEAFKHPRMMNAIFSLQNSEEKIRPLASNLASVIIFHAIEAIGRGEFGYKEFTRSPFMRMMLGVAEPDVNPNIADQLSALFDLKDVDQKVMATEPLVQDFFKKDHNVSRRILPFDGFEKFDNKYEFGNAEAADLRLQCDRFLMLHAPQARQGAGVIL